MGSALVADQPDSDARADSFTGFSMPIGARTVLRPIGSNGKSLRTVKFVFAL